MTAKLLTVHPEPPVNPEVITLLTEICGWVQNDEVSAVGITIVHRDGSTGICFSRPASMATLIGAVERLKHRLITDEAQ